MTDYIRVVSKIKESPWLITEDSLRVILEIMNLRLAGNQLSEQDIKSRISDTELGPRGSDEGSVQRGIGVIPIYGPIFPRASMLAQISGVQSLENIKTQFRTMMNDPRVESVLFDIDSPGGMSDGIPEMGEEIRQARETKPIYAVANTMAGSAAYWLGAQATKFYASPSSLTGSIGAYSVHEDISRAEANAGKTTTLVYAGKYKVEGNPYEPLTTEGRDYRQNLIDQLYGDFVQAVADGRGVSTEKVMSDFGEGRVMTAKDSAKAGMVDGVRTFDEVLSNLSETGSPEGEINRTGMFARAMNMLNRAGFLSVGGIKLEHADWEHSEPGSGPLPRPNPDPTETLGGDDRIDTPPPDPFPNQEASMNDEQLVQLRAALGLPENTEFAQMIAEATKLGELNQGITQASATIEKQRTFAEMYPDEAREMQELREERMETRAQAFADMFAGERIKDAEGKDTTRGFSGKVIEEVKKVHLLFSKGEGTVEAFEGVCSAIANDGVVEYGEIGSSRNQRETRAMGDRTYSNGAEARKAFAGLVADVKAEKKEEGKEISHGDALAEAATRDPELFDAYMNMPVGG